MALNIADRTTNIILETVEHYNKNYDSSLGDSLLKDVNNTTVTEKMDRVILLPIAPQECMFNSNNEIKRETLLNGGEITIGGSKKLDTWSISSIFPYTNTNNLPYVIKAGNSGNGAAAENLVPHPYQFFCDTLYYWQQNFVPLVFKLKTWGSYYRCLIENFKYGIKDNTGDVWYSLSFVEYKECTIFGRKDKVYVATTESPWYTAKEGQDILNLCQEVYGTSDAFKFFMQMNGMTNTELEAGKKYAVR